MLRTFWALLDMTALSGDDSHRPEVILRVSVLTLLAATLLAVALDQILGPRFLLSPVLIGGAALFLLAHRLTARGRLSAARALTVISLLGMLSFSLYTSPSGIHSVGSMMLPTVIVVGSLILGRPGFLIVTGMTVLSAAGLVVADVNGLIVTRYHEVSRYQDVIGPTLFLLLTAVMVRLSAAELIRTGERARRSQHALMKANRQLEAQAAELASVQQARHLESLGVLAGGIAHDFNNLLLSIAGNIELAAADLPETASVRAHLDEAQKATRRASELTRQMLAYSGKGRFAARRIESAAWLRALEPSLREAVTGGARLEIAIAPELPPIEADTLQLRQAVVNLVTNADEAVGNGPGTITVAARAVSCTQAAFADAWYQDMPAAGIYVAIEVSDTGAGIPDEHLSRIFDPFFTTKFVGRGLGLPVVLGIVRGHKGAIKVASEAGRGTTIRIFLPALRTGQGTAEPSAWEDAADHTRRAILVVDDEDSVRRLAKSMLERMGYDVVTAASGRQAIEIYRQHRDRIHGVLLDLTMPHMDGHQTLLALRDVDPGVRVILTSGFSEQEVAERFGDARPTAFIAKPYTLQMLGEALTSALA
jgi:signal transduction histidine kinase/CheY-like chemotaxis protein